ncbi:MAG: hypothetical protein J6I72_07270 [Muribaculaceae bacterium]|nr:hypothetical protein [Muribaculaceae bacterium]
MKKLFTLLMVVAIAVTASAQVPFIGRTSQSNKVLKRENVGKSKRTGLHQKAPRRALGELITTQPEGELRSYVRSGGNIYQGWDAPACISQSGMTDVVFAPDGTTVYLRDAVFDVVSDAWIKGYLNEDGTKITVPTGQCIYWDESAERGMMVYWMSTSVSIPPGEENPELSLTVHQGLTEVTYTIAADGTISLDNTVGDINAEFPNNYVATGLGVVYSDDLGFCAMDFNTVYKQFQLVPAVPADPIIYEDSWFNSGEEDGYSCFDFKVLPQDVDGNLIDLSYTSYSIFTDDDVPFVFDAETYVNDLAENMTEIPYEIYNGGYDFDASRIYFYRTNMGDNPMFYNRIGIQVHYDVPVTDEDGVTTTVRNSSNIVYWDNLGTGISEVKSAPVVDDAYYNVMGQRFVSAAGLPAGIYIHQGKKVLVK